MGKLKPPEHGALSATDLDTYRLIAERQPLPKDREVTTLAALRLVGPDPYRPGQYAAHDPRVAAHSLMAGLAEEFGRALDQARAVPAMISLGRHYDPHRLYGGVAAELLPSQAEMNDRIVGIVGAATDHVWTAQPGEPADRDPEIVALGVSRTLTALRNGVGVTCLYNTMAYSHRQMHDAIGALADAGAELRLLGAVFPRMIIVDDHHLFIDNHLLPGEADSGWHVTDRATIAWARTVFGCYWDRGTRWADFAALSKGAVATPRQRQILAELEAGYSQQQAARRIGAAERTVAKDLTTLRDALGLRTVNQVMMWWATSTDRQLP